MLRLVLEALVVLVAAEVLRLGLVTLLHGDSRRIHPVWQAALLTVVVGSWIYWRAPALVRFMDPSVIRPAGRTPRSPLPLAILVLVLGCAGTLLAAQALQRTIADAAQAKFERQRERLESEVRRRFQKPVYGMMGGRGVYAAGMHVNQAAWRGYVHSRNLAEEFPGVRGFGVIERVARDDIDRFVDARRLEGQPDFELRNPSRDATLYVVKYVEPLAANREALGLDAGYEPTRRHALERAIDSGQLTLSPRITLVQDRQQGPGFLMLLPVYRDGMVPATPAERRATLTALICAPIVASELLKGTLESIGAQLAFSLYDGSETPEHRVFEVGTMPAPSWIKRMAWRPLPLVTSSLDAVDIGGRQLWIRAAPAADFWLAVDDWSPSLLRVTGTFASMLLALTLWLLASGEARARALAHGMTAELRRMAEVVRHTSNAVVVTDRDRSILWVNAGFSRLYGYAPEEAIGRTPGQLLGSGRTDPATEAAIREAGAAGRSCRVEVVNRAKDAREHVIDLEIQPRHDDTGQLIGFMQIGQDISATKRASLALSRALDTLTHERQRLDQIIEGTDAGTWEWDLQTHRLTCNPRWASMVGYSPGDLAPLGMRRWRSLCHPGDAHHAVGLLRRYLDGATPYFECEMRLQHRRGHWVWVLVRGRVFDRAPDGRARSMAGTQMDINERKRAEEQLRASKAFLARAEHVAGVGGWEVDLRSGKLMWSEQTFRIYGVPLGQQPELVAAYDFFAPPERELIERTARECIDRHTPWDLELPITTRDGRRLWIRSIGSVEVEAGRSVRLVGTIQDITAVWRVREELRRSNAVLRSIVDNLPCGLSVFDADLRLVACNATYRELLDLPPALVSAPDPGFAGIIRHNATRGDYGPDPVDEIVDRMVTNARVPRHMRSERELPGGRALEVRSAPMPGGGFVTTYMDITERRNMERLKGEFISTVTHELRTPMTAIHGALSLLDSGVTGPLPDGARELVARSAQSSDRLVRLINDVLDVERIQARLMRYAMAPQSLASLVDQAIDATRAYAGQHAVALELQARCEAVRVLADADRIVQVMVNLLSNAVKFSGPSKRVAVRMTADRSQVRVSVIDDGPGIPESFRARVFERFAQADSSDRRQKGGTGLGLNICRSIITEHGGHIDYHSVPGEGSEFYFDLPLFEEP